MRTLTVRKHVRVPPWRKAVPTESHNDGQRASYFLRTLRTLLSSLGFSEPPLLVGTPRLLYGNSYLWHVRMIFYERSMTDHIHRICQVVKATREALAVLWHEEDDQMEHSQYRHFLSYAREGAEAMVMHVGDHDRIGCFADQVKLTRALVWDLDEAVKEVKLLGECWQS
jgi:hypothetical protein